MGKTSGHSLTVKLLRGIQASGKSTLRKKLSRKPGWQVVSRDELRLAVLGKVFGEPHEEDLISKLEQDVLERCLAAKQNVIIDSTNIRPKYLKRYFDSINSFRRSGFNIVVEPIELKEDLKTCIQRNQHRDNPVPKDVIEKTYKRFVASYNDWWEEFARLNAKADVLLQNESKPECIIFDIDGTLAIRSDRSPFDWERVKEDTLNVPVYKAYLAHLSAGTPIIICTGRDGVCETLTKEWLAEHNIGYVDFYIRRASDFRPDYVVKEEMWRKILKDWKISGCYDDRGQVVEHARRLGLTVFDVAGHKF